MGEQRITAQVSDGSLNAAEFRADGNVRAARVSLDKIELIIALEDARIIGINSEKLNCISLPLELPTAYEAWIEMRSSDRSMLEKRFFGSPIEEVVQRLKRDHPDWL